MLPIYNSAEEFFKANEAPMKEIGASNTKLMSMSELMTTGDVLTKCDELSYEFLRLMNVVSQIRLGLTASVIRAKEGVKTTEGVIYRALEGSATEKKMLIPSMQEHVTASDKLADLTDISDYLQQKYEAFQSAHVYYKNLASRR